MSDTKRIPPRYTDFVNRLHWALEKHGVDSLDEQVQLVASATNVTHRTARRYLAGASRPRNIVKLDALANRLGVFSGWLAWGGSAPRTLNDLDMYQKLLRMWADMSDEEKAQLQRVLFRLKNRSARVVRLARMQREGLISFKLLLELGGSRPA